MAIGLFPVARTSKCEIFSKRTVGKDGIARCHGKVATTNEKGYWERPWAGGEEVRAVRCG
jgi:hypothetical protein